MAHVATLQREGSVQLRTSGQKVVLEQTDTFQIVADAAKAAGTYERADLLNATGLPTVKVNFKGDMQCTGISISADPLHARYFTAQVTWSSDVKEDSGGGDLPDDPTEWSPIADLDFESYNEVFAKDVNNKAFVNTAKDPFATGIEIPRRLAVRAFTQFEHVGYNAPVWQASTPYRLGQYVTNAPGIYRCIQTGTSAAAGGPTGTNFVIIDGTAKWTYVPAPPNGAVNLYQIMNRCDTINQYQFLSCAPKTLRLEVRKASIGTYYGYKVWRIDYALKYKPDTWTLKMLNVGYFYKSGLAAPNDKAAFLKPSDPANPNSPKVAYLGKLAADGTALANQATADPLYEEFEPYSQLDFRTFLRVTN